MKIPRYLKFCKVGISNNVISFLKCLYGEGHGGGMEIEMVWRARREEDRMNWIREFLSDEEEERLNILRQKGMKKPVPFYKRRPENEKAEL